MIYALVVVGYAVMIFISYCMMRAWDDLHPRGFFYECPPSLCAIVWPLVLVGALIYTAVTLVRFPRICAGVTGFFRKLFGTWSRS